MIADEPTPTPARTLQLQGGGDKTHRRFLKKKEARLIVFHLLTLRRIPLLRRIKGKQDCSGMDSKRRNAPTQNWTVASLFSKDLKW